MALDIIPTQPKRSYVAISLGLILIGIAGFLLYDVERQKSSYVYAPSDHEYRVKQSVKTQVNYVDNSFFPSGPGPNNSAYVKDLTESISAEFLYNLETSDEASAVVTYDIKARVLGKHSERGDEEKTVNLWSREYQLVAPVTKTFSGRRLSIEPKADVPFALYEDEIEQFKAALSVPINSEMVVLTTIKAKGTIGDIEFEDSRVMSITAPLDRQAYTLAIKYDKEDTKPVVAKGTENGRDQRIKYTTIGAIIALIGGTALVGFGFRKQIFKTPYQRELEKIYRYHDGIIIKARQPANIDGKRIVPVLTFDDMLNLEEELKSPIVASPAGSEATQFILVHSDIAYVYTLGKLILEDDSSAPMDDIVLDERRSVRKKSKKS